MSRPYDFYGLSYDAQRRIRQSEHDLRKARARAHQNNNAAAEAESLRAANTELVEALREAVAELDKSDRRSSKGAGKARAALSLYGDDR